MVRFSWLALGALLTAVPLRAQSAPVPTQILRYPAPEPREESSLRMGLLFSSDGKTLVGFDGDGAVNGSWGSWDTQTGRPIHDRGQTWFPFQLCRVADRVVLIEKGGDPTPPKIGLVKAVAPTSPTASDLVIPAAALTKHGWYAGALSHVSLARNEHLAACVTCPADDESDKGPAASNTAPALALAFVGEILLFDPSSGTVVRGLKSPEDPVVGEPTAVVADLAISPDGKRVATVLSNGSRIVWSCADGKLAFTQPAPAAQIVYEPLKLYVEGDNPQRIGNRKIVWIGNEEILTTIVPKPDPGAGDVRRLARWRLSSKSPELLEWKGTPPETSDSAPSNAPSPAANTSVPSIQRVHFVACSPDGKRALLVLAAVGEGKRAVAGIEVVDLSSSTPIGRLKVSRSMAVTSAVFSPDSSRVVLGIRSGALLITSVSRLEQFARENKSIAELSSVDAPVAKESRGATGGANANSKGEKKPAAVQKAASETEFRLPRTGVFLKTRLKVALRYWPPRATHDTPPMIGLDERATLYCTSAACSKERDFETVRAALQKRLVDDVPRVDDEFVQEPLSVPGGTGSLFSKPSRPRSPLFAVQYEGPRVMYALVSDGKTLIEITVSYANESPDELYAPLREMLTGLRWQTDYAFDPFEGTDWSATVPSGLQAVPFTSLMLTENGETGKHGREWVPSDVDPAPVVWITFQFGPNEYALDDPRANDTNWYDVASRSLKGVRDAMVRNSVHFDGAGTTGWEFVATREDAHLTLYQVIMGGPLVTGEFNFTKTHRFRVRVFGMVSTDQAEEWVPKFRALARSLTRRES